MPPIMIDGAEGLMELLSGASKSNGRSPRQNPTEPETQMSEDQVISRLSEFYAQVYEPAPEKFEAGDIIYHKNPSLADISEVNQPLIFLGYLPEPVDALALARKPVHVSTTLASRVYDCRFGMLRGGGTFCEYLGISRHFTVRPSARRR